MNEETFQTIFKKFKEKFPPAGEDNFSFKLTSVDLYQTFARFYPGAFSEETLFNQMITEGYKYLPENKLGIINFHWLMREAKSDLG